MKLFELERRMGFPYLTGLYGLESYAAAYWRAAKTMIDKKMFDGQGRPYFSTFPIAFLYRRALELMLKAILIEHDHCFSERPALVLNRGHLLKGRHDKDIDYLKDLRTIIDQAGERTTGEPVVAVTPEQWAHLQTVLDGWKEHDPDGMAFRYSVDKKAEKPLTGHDFTFDIEHLAQAMEGALEVLSSIKDELDQLRYQGVLRSEGLKSHP